MSPDARETWAAGLLIVAMGAAAVAPTASIVVHGSAYAIAWTSLVVLTLGTRPPRWAPALLLFVPIYLASSFWSPESREGIDTWFQADHWRYVAAARDGSISPRHLGLPAFLGASRGVDDAAAAETLLCAGSAVAAALATGASIRAIGASRAGASGIAILLAGSFTLGRWAFAGVIETTAYSLALWAAGFRIAISAALSDGSRPWALGWILAAALGVSLDNVFFAVPLIALTGLRPGLPAARRVRETGVLSAAVLSGYVAISVAAAYGGRVADELGNPGSNAVGSIAGLRDHANEFAALYLHPEHILRPMEFAWAGFRVFVMSVVAQPGLPSATYSHNPRPWMLYEPATIAWIALAAVLAYVAWPGIRARCAATSTVERAGVLALIAFVALRFLWHVVYASREVLLFSAQIHLALALVLAFAAGASTSYRKALLVVGASLVGTLLLLVNGVYLANLP